MTAPAAGDPLDAFPGLLDCVHCGLCLEECPTYRVTRLETESPRGRLALMRSVAEGRLEAVAAAGPLGRCLQCRACEPVCPSQVGYAHLLETHQEGKSPFLLRWVLRKVLPSRFLVGALGLLLRLSRRLGLLRLLERARPPAADDAERPAGRMQRLRALAGAVPASPRRFVPGAGSVFPPVGEARGRVVLHLGCAAAELLGDVLRDTVSLFTAQGFEVVVPRQPACCGALHAHAGDAEFGASLARATAAAFESSHAGLGPIDAVIVPAAGCLAHLLERNPAAPFDEPLLFLHRAGLTLQPGPYPARVAYDPPCHLRNVLGAKDEIPALLRRIPRLELVPHQESELCCGAGGISFAREPVAGFAVTERKVRLVREQRPSHLASGNPGCLLRLEAELRRTGGGIEAVHPVSLLARACAVSAKPEDDGLRAGASPSGTSSRR